VLNSNIGAAGLKVYSPKRAWRIFCPAFSIAAKLINGGYWCDIKSVSCLEFTDSFSQPFEEFVSLERRYASRKHLWASGDG
jgi:hypothetical protein